MFDRLFNHLAHYVHIDGPEREILMESFALKKDPGRTAF